MTPADIAERAQRIAAVRADDSADRSVLKLALAEAGQVKAWAEAQVAGLVGKLAAAETFPEATIAETSRCSLGQAGKTKERADTLGATPTLADALENGAVTTGHVDAVTRGTKKLEPEQREEFMGRVENLVDIAAASTIDQFSKRLDLEIRKLQSGDGEDRLTRQRRDTRLSSWVDVDGMWNLRGRFDPVTGMKLAAKIDQATRARFSDETPAHCPSDPVEKNKFLAAHALAGLVDDSGSRSSSSNRPEFVVVIDADSSVETREGRPAIDWPIPVEVPDRVLREMMDDGDVHAVVVRNGVVLYAPGALDLGRTTRLASRAQRRALRALYRGCAIPGCTVAYDRCKLHHIIWWRHGGRTDLDNLLPLCSKHHGNVHHDGWIVELSPDRQLSLTLPDGRVMNTGPPRRSAA